MKTVAFAMTAALLLVPVVWATVGGGDITYEVKAAGKVVFSHDNHVASLGPKCTVCHDALFITKQKDKRATMVQMQKGQSCGACHDGKKSFAVKGNCNSCHQK